MNSVIDRLKKRRCYPVAIGDETVHCRALTIGEIRVLDTLAPDLQTAFAIGCALTDDQGLPQFPRLDPQAQQPGCSAAAGLLPARETNEEFAQRMVPIIEEFPTDNLREISLAIGRLNEVPLHGELVKN